MPLSAVQSRKGSPTPVGPPSKRKTHVPAERPPFERIALILQGGGALGAYQAGVYQALAEADLHPDWVAGISIGAVNAAIIAGNPPERRVQQLRAFWETVTQPNFGVPNVFAGLDIHGEHMHAAVNQLRSLGILLGGAPGFFTPRMAEYCGKFPVVLTHVCGGSNCDVEVRDSLVIA